MCLGARRRKSAWRRRAVRERACNGGVWPDMFFMSETKPPLPRSLPAAALESKPAAPGKMPKEIGGPKGPEPTRYGDWEVKGRCSDF